MLDKFKLDGKVAIVTGGNGGIGRGIVHSLADAGANIAVAARNENKTEKVVAEVKEMGREAIGIKTDVLKQEDIDNMVKITLDKFGRIDILVNNSGVSIPKAAEALTRKEWDFVTGVNLDAVFFCSQAVGKHMIPRKQGKIINVSSAYGIGGAKFSAAYCAAKAGVLNLTRAMAVEWAFYQIQVNAIAPGFIDTDMTAGFKAVPEMYKKYVNSAPMKRAGQADEVGPAALFLASEASSYVTGHTLIVDGGVTIL